MADFESPNPRPRRSRRMRDEDDATSAPPSANAQHAARGEDAGASSMPPHQEPAQAPPPPPQHAQQQHASQQPPPPASDPFAGPELLNQLLQFVVQSQQRQQEQFTRLMEQQAFFQQQMLATQAQLRAPPKKKGNPPTFNGEGSEDLELYLFSTEQYYSEFKAEMERNTSDFVDTVFANLGPIVQAWFREFKLSLGPNVPITWALFKQRIRERFRDSDFQQKVLTKLFELRIQTTQQEYTTKFLHLLSQLDDEMPEFIKRWFYQQGLRPETSSFVSQHVPATLQDVVELAQRFEDSRPSQAPRKSDAKATTKPQPASAQRAAPTSAPSNGTPVSTCSYCNKPRHTAAVCRKRIADEAAGVGAPKN